MNKITMKETTKTASIILATATLVSGGFLLTTDDKAQLEKELEARNTFQVENVVDKSGTPVFESHGTVTKVVIDGVEYLPQ